MTQLNTFESVAVSTRIRLARNFKDYPFPARLLKDKHAEEQAHEIVRLIAAELAEIEDFSLYEMRSVSDERAAFLTERYLISRDLIRNRAISAALVSRDETISVMLNEEDHVREQYFTQGFDLKKAPNVTFVDCGRADEETVMRWIYTRFKREQIYADTEVCERVMRYCLADMSRVAGETEKLVAYAGRGGKLTSDDVDAIVFRDTDYRIYEMTGAISAGNYTKYASVMAELKAKGADEMNLLNGLCSYFRSLFEIAAMKKSDAETAAALGMKEYAVKMSRRQAAAFTPISLKKCYTSLYRAIGSVKSGRLTPEGALLRANAEIFFDLKPNNRA